MLRPPIRPKRLKNRYPVNFSRANGTHFTWIETWDNFLGQYLQLAPAEEIVFRREDGETTGMLVMNNTANCNVAYKVLTLEICIIYFVISEL